MNISLLIVEDNEVTALFHRAMLEKLNCNVSVVGSGEEFIKIYKKQFDVILMDIGLPGMDGFEAFKKVRVLKQFNMKSLVYACTAFGDQVKKQAIDAGMHGVIEKPCTERVFKEIINLALKKRVESAKKCKAAGMDGFLTKPLSKAQLKQFLTHQTEHERPVTEPRYPMV